MTRRRRNPAFRPRRNPSGGISLTTLALVGGGAYLLYRQQPTLFKPVTDALGIGTTPTFRPAPGAPSLPIFNDKQRVAL